MTYCSKCGEEISPDSSYCLNCGAKQPLAEPTRRTSRTLLTALVMVAILILGAFYVIQQTFKPTITSTPPVTPVPTPTTPLPPSTLLEGREWVLVSFGDKNNPKSLLTGTEITARFKNNTVGGAATCNSYSAEYKVDDNTLTIKNVLSTMMYCYPAELMQQEQAYLSALQSARSFQIVNNKLEITYDGGTMIFTARALA